MLLLLLIVLLHVTCITSTCVSNFNIANNIDYFPIKMNGSMATTFTITYHNYYKVITLLDTTGPITYVLYQCGTQIPTDALLSTAIKVSVPVTKVATASTTHLPFIEVLGYHYHYYHHYHHYHYYYHYHHYHHCNHHHYHHYHHYHHHCHHCHHCHHHYHYHHHHHHHYHHYHHYHYY